MGAGFSQPAGLPLATQLFEKVIENINDRYGNRTKFHSDLDEFKSYSEKTNTQYNLESFMSYLDIEHFLRLRGSKTFKDEGNESQIMVRRAIGHVIHSHTPGQKKIPEVYYKFASALRPHDIVLTFNYDIILEKVLEHLDIPFRLFPARFTEIHGSSATVDSEANEIVILKLHGSIDWFDDTEFRVYQKKANDYAGKFIRHPIFDDLGKYQAVPLAEGPRFLDDPLLHIHRIKLSDKFYQIDRSFEAPFILAPSTVKFVYAKPLIDFWNGLGRTGAYNLGFSVIGFSLPMHDEYIRVLLFKLTQNYQSWWDSQLSNTLKENVRIIDYRTKEFDIENLKQRYSFIDSDRCDFWLSGFNEDSVEFLQRKER